MPKLAGFACRSVHSYVTYRVLHFLLRDGTASERLLLKPMDNCLYISVGPNDLSGSNLGDVICFGAFQRSAQDCYKSFALGAAARGSLGSHLVLSLQVECSLWPSLWVLHCMGRSVQMLCSRPPPLTGCTQYLRGLQPSALCG